MTSQGNTNGVQISMFDLAEHLNNKWDGRNGVRIQDGYLAQVEEERRQNSLIWSIEQKSITKILEQGFEIEVIKSGGIREKITDPNETPFLAALWHEQISDAIRFRLRYGFCVVVPRVIRNPFSASAERERLEAEEAKQQLQKKSNLPAQTSIADTADNPESATNDEEIKQFLLNERNRMEKSRPRDAPSMRDTEVLGYSVPQILNPLTECYIKFYTGPDEQRVYQAFRRKVETNSNQPIPNSLVIIFNAPDSDGVPQSPILACLEDLQTARGMFQRWEQRDFINTHQPWVYRSIPRTGGESLIPNETHINYSETGTEEAGGTMPSSVWKGKVRVEDHTLEKRIAQLEASNRYMDKALEDSLEKAMTPGTKMTRPMYNHQLEKLTHIKAIDQFGPYHIIPEQMEISPNVPKPQHSQDWLAVYNLLITRIFNTVGVTSESFTNDHAITSADAESRRNESDSALRAAQSEIERTIAQIYVAIFMPIHKAEIAAKLGQNRYDRRSERLRQSEDANDRRITLHKEIEELRRAFASTAEDGVARPQLHDDKKKKKRELSAIPLLDIDADEMPWDDDKEYTGDTGVKTEHDRIDQGERDKYMQIYLETQLQVKVHVRENPSISYIDAKNLHTDKIITRERFGQMALRVLGLPADYLATEEELNKESLMLAKREKNYNDQSGANDMVRASVGESSAPKRQKTGDSNPDQGE